MKTELCPDADPTGLTETCRLVHVYVPIDSKKPPCPARLKKKFEEEMERKRRAEV